MFHDNNSLHNFTAVINKSIFDKSSDFGKHELFTLKNLLSKNLFRSLTWHCYCFIINHSNRILLIVFIAT